MAFSMKMWPYLSQSMLQIQCLLSQHDCLHLTLKLGKWRRKKKCVKTWKDSNLAFNSMKIMSKHGWRTEQTDKAFASNKILWKDFELAFVTMKILWKCEQRKKTRLILRSVRWNSRKVWRLLLYWPLISNNIQEVSQQ